MQACSAQMTVEACSLRMRAARQAGAQRRESMCNFTCCCQVLEGLGGRGPCRGVAKCGGNHIVHNLRAGELLSCHHGCQAGRPCNLQLQPTVYSCGLTTDCSFRDCPDLRLHLFRCCRAAGPCILGCSCSMPIEERSTPATAQHSLSGSAQSAPCCWRLLASAAAPDPQPPLGPSLPSGRGSRGA